MRLFALTTYVVVAATSAFAGVTVTAPANNSTVGTSVQYVATATTTCSQGIGSMGIYTAPGQLAYVVSGATLNHSLVLSPGTYNTVVQAWNRCGTSTWANVTIKVGSGSPAPSTGGNTFSNLHQKGGWTGYALLPTSFAICKTCSPTGPQATWSRQTGYTSPSVSGSATRHNIGGKTQYADILWNNHLIGDFSSQGLPDTSHTLAPKLHNFTYDVYFFGNNIPASQALEFDINQFVNGKSFIWGHECRIAGGHQWDVWNNRSAKWVPTGIPCNPVNNAWNHLVIQVQRTSNDQLLFKSITLNGKTATLNHLDSPTSTNWYGITINYQQDLNNSPTPYSIWLDRLNFSYW
jgi:hypothetical protein